VTALVLRDGVVNTRRTLEIPSIMRVLLVVCSAAVLAFGITASAGFSLSRSATFLYVSPNGSDFTRCTRVAPCHGFDRAYHLARPGDVVHVASGVYPSQSIGLDPSKANASSDVVFKGTADGSVHVAGELKIYARHLSLNDMTIGDWYAGANDSRVSPDRQAGFLTFRNVHTRDFYVSGASNVSVIGGSVGPSTDPQAGAAQIKPCYRCTYSVTNIRIVGVNFHDVTRTSVGEDRGIHTECLHVWGGVSNIVIRNSRFTNCAIMDVFIENDHGLAGDIRDVTVENNFFDVPGSTTGGASAGSYSLYVAGQGGSLHNVDMRFNSFLSTAIVDSFRGDSTKLAFVGNVGVRPAWQCEDGVEFAYNVWDHAKCSTTDRRGILGFERPSANNLHLLQTSSALGAVPLAVAAPATDIDAQRRPLRAPRDAGADQREPARLTLSAGLGSVRLGEPDTSVRSAYGSPRSRSRLSIRGSKPLTVDVFRVPGGKLWTYSSAGVVVGVRTTSSYYSTAGGLGVGTPLKSRRSYRWLKCPHAYAGHAGRTSVFLFASRSGKPAPIVRAVFLLREGFQALRACR
jgi:hypothetical protein